MCTSGFLGLKRYMLPPHEVCGALGFFLVNRKIHRFSPSFTVSGGPPSSTYDPWTCAAEQVPLRSREDVATMDEPQVGRGTPSFLLPQPPTRARDPKTRSHAKWLPAGQPALFQPHTPRKGFWRHPDEFPYVKRSTASYVVAASETRSIFI